MAGDVRPPWPEGRWRALLADGISRVDDLLAVLDLGPEAVGIGPHGDPARQFGLRVPRGYVDLIQRGNPTDPLLLQILPRGVETRFAPGFSTDPVGEIGAGEGAVIQKYGGRVLVVVTGACAVHCRYCFRRHFPYGDRAGVREETLERLSRLDPDISEVILSGGDPLVLGDATLDRLIGAARTSPGVRRLRIHTRTPVVLPQRVDSGLLRVLASADLPVVMVLHANHAREIGPDLATACRALGNTGITLLNQAVLLAGVNDTVEAQTDLAERLFEVGVLPYYLHLLDPVAGAAHFDVPEELARSLMARVSARLPGYLVPRLVREIPGRASKTVVAPEAGSEH